MSPVRFANCSGWSDWVIASTLLDTTWETIRMSVSSSLQAERSAAVVSVGVAVKVVALADVAGALDLPPQAAGTTASAASASTWTHRRRMARSVAPLRPGRREGSVIMGRVRPRRAVALISLTVIAVGCSSGSKKEQAQAVGPAVPWTSKKPPQVAERVPSATPCRAADLEVPGQVRFVPRLQGGVALAVVRNAGARTCRLSGRPRVTFVKSGGPVQVEKPVPTTPSNFPETTYPASSLLALRPGESGAVTITWDNWCDLVIKGKPHLPPSAVRITLPDGRGSIAADYNAVPRCIDANAPTTIGVSVFQPTLVRTGRPWSQAFLSASVPGQPIHARRGETLHFRVVLRNSSQAPARFEERCPAYIQQLAPRGKVEVYDLNCPAAHSIAPGKNLAFAMRAHVPRNAPLGGNGLFWELDPFGARAPQLHARVTIDG